MVKEENFVIQSHDYDNVAVSTNPWKAESFCSILRNFGRFIFVTLSNGSSRRRR